jgi:ribosomal protein S18 acetylase RimI-like enzyme
MSIAIRTAHPDDFEAVLSFWHVATEIASSTDDLAGLGTLYETDPGALLVATEAGAIVGTLIATWDGWRGSFCRLAVHPDHRREGLARALVAEGQQRLSGLGCRRIGLFAVGTHAGAVAFWSAVGFTEDQEDVRFVTDLPSC